MLKESPVRSAEQVARIGKVLSAEPRVRIVQMLKRRPLCVGALAARPVYYCARRPATTLP